MSEAPDVSENLAALLHEMTQMLRDHQRTTRRDEGALVVLASAFIRFVRSADSVSRDAMEEYLKRPPARLVTPDSSADAIEGAAKMAQMLLDNIREQPLEIDEGVGPVVRRDRTDESGQIGESLVGW